MFLDVLTSLSAEQKELGGGGGGGTISIHKGREHMYTHSLASQSVAGNDGRWMYLVLD